MLRKILVIIICIAIVILIFGCSASSNENSSTIKYTNSIINTTKKTANATIKMQTPITSNNNSSNKGTSIDTLNKVVADLHLIGIDDCWAGYDIDNNISVCVNAQNDKKYEGVDEGNAVYNIFVIKKIFEKCNNVASVYIMSNYAGDDIIFNMTKGIYLQSGLKDAPDSVEFFNNNWNKYYKESDRYAFDNLSVQAGDKYDPRVALKSHMSQMFGQRLLSADIEDEFDGAVSLTLKLNGLPDDVNSEIANAFNFVLGRFSDNLPFDSVLKMTIEYENNGNPIFNAIMTRDFIDNPEYNNWLASGLKVSDWTKYATVQIEDSKYKLPYNVNNNYVNSTVENDPGYNEVFDTLKSSTGVKNLILGYDGSKYNAFITLQSTNEQQDFKNEMDITQEAMKYPLDNIWFMVFDADGKGISTTYMDRERYNILMYMNDTGNFDFTPKEWPIMAAGFGDISQQ